MKKVIVISAIWCPSCLLLKKHLKKLKQDYPNIDIETLDYDFDDDKVKNYNVGNILPVMICDDNRLIGEKDYNEIIKFLKDSGCI